MNHYKTCRASLLSSICFKHLEQTLEKINVMWLFSRSDLIQSCSWFSLVLSNWIFLTLGLEVVALEKRYLGKPSIKKCCLNTIFFYKGGGTFFCHEAI